MGMISEAFATINSTIRTLSLAVLTGVLATAGFLGFQHITAGQRALMEMESELVQAKNRLLSVESELGSAREEIALQQEFIEKLETSLHLLKTDQRLAQLRVVNLQRDEQGDVVASDLEFTELSPSGQPISQPKKFTLPGDVVYIDNWVVKFEDQFVEQADIERGTSLVLFRRVFSEKQTPAQGVSLDEVGMRPQAYSRGGGLTEFERRLWTDFWEFANDPKKAAEMGIRAANGEAISIQVREGMTYQLQLRSSGGLSFQPMVDSTGDNQPVTTSDNQ
jgi:hypothetical protein